jgi:hypothetical protein
MRRLIPAALVVLLVAAVAAWLITARTPAIDAELARLPGVTEVRASGSNWPRATVVHLLDWHLVPPEHLNPPGQPGLIVTGKSRRYADHLDAVESVQREHEAILRRLAAKHGTLTVYVEGLTQHEVGHFAEKARQLARIDSEDIPETRRMLDKVNALKQTPATKATADELRQMLARHREEMLKTGATRRLIAEGLVEVRALEDAEALRRAKPNKDGIDAQANAAREEEMAKRLAGVVGLSSSWAVSTT